ncbi:hypothetical protein [Nitrosomonas ureae]|uniref:Uncharacterized protein n=1 Tax=Nitrosomonas ureae TaxID=44577 RepID=A0A2T5IIR2_9PROT|nr:hypothetical protein [Nitrosomonas ureae]PTQ83681.1 hypothetical protein C8R28_10225 [Nitrosomonas ureae]
MSKEYGGGNGHIGNISIEEKEMNAEEFYISHEGPAVLINSFYLASGHWGIKIVFAEQLRQDTPPAFRTAIVMSKQEAIALQKALQKVLSTEASEDLKLVTCNESENQKNSPYNDPECA